MKSIDSICLQNGDAKKKKKEKSIVKSLYAVCRNYLPENQDRRGEIGATYEIETHKLVNTERRKADLVELQYYDALAEKHPQICRQQVGTSMMVKTGLIRYTVIIRIQIIILIPMD